MSNVYELSFLINPISGDGMGKRVYKQLGEILDSFGMDRTRWTAELTDPNRLVEQADNLIRTSEKLIAVGGDGTIGLVLDRVRRLQPTTAIGLIPLGTGNDLARSLGIYRVYDAKGLIACLKQLLKAQSQSFDLWDVGGKATLVSYLSAGLDASVIRNFDQARKLGKLQGGSFKNKLYYLKSFCSQLHYRLPEGSHARIETSDGVFELPLAGRRAFLAANINSYAAGAHPFSGGRFDDGVLEIAVFASVWKYIFVTVGSRSYPTVAQWMRRKLRWYRAYTVTLTLPAGTPVQLDGEDFTSAAQESAITISFAARVQLLDLRRSFYALF